MIESAAVHFLGPHRGLEGRIHFPLPSDRISALPIPDSEPPQISRPQSGGFGHLGRSTGTPIRSD